MWTSRYLSGAISVRVLPLQSVKRYSRRIIATRLLLGSNVGLPATFICIARKLEFVSSQREPPPDGQNKRVQIAIDVALCIVLPIIYILLRESSSKHLDSAECRTVDYIAQDRRFDLVRDLGCFASIHPSTPALIIVWLPPLLTCSIALLYCGTWCSFLEYILDELISLQVSLYITHSASRLQVSVHTFHHAQHTRLLSSYAPS